jgi:hypothetical protein
MQKAELIILETVPLICRIRRIRADDEVGGEGLIPEQPWTKS